MPKFTEEQREIITQIIWELDRIGTTPKTIQNKLEEKGYQLSERQIIRYKEGIASQLAQNTKQLIEYDKLQLEQDINEKINNAQKALSESKSNIERDKWFNRIIDARSRLVLLREGMIMGFEVGNGSLSPDGEKRPRKEAVKEFAQFIESTNTK